MEANAKTIFDIVKNEKRPKTVRPRKPVQVFIVEPYIKQLTLMPNIFARVDDIRYDYDAKNISVVIRPNSWALKLPFLLFKTSLKRFFNENKLTVLVAEVNADLTHIELETLGSLHTAMRKIAEDLNLINKDAEFEDIINMIKRNKDRVLHLLAGVIFTKKHKNKEKR